MLLFKARNPGNSEFMTKGFGSLEKRVPLAADRVRTESAMVELRSSLATSTELMGKARIKTPAYGERRDQNHPLKPVYKLTSFQVHQHCKVLIR